MSEGPELSEAEALAAEHALGVLTGAERAAAELRMARDPAFAAEVEAWRRRLAPLMDEVASETPRAAVWSRVERALPANDDRRALRFWRGATVGALSLAAASLAIALFVATRPPVVLQAPAQPQPMLSASLTSQAGGQPMFVAAYDPARKALIITSLMPPGDRTHVHELWLIPADGKPHALGMVAPGASKAMPMPDPMTPMIAPGATLAVSIEPPGGSPRRDAPSGPIAAAGKLSRV